MFERIKNLVELSKFRPEEGTEKIILKKTIEDKPKGMAQVLEDEPADLFADEPNQND